MGQSAGGLGHAGRCLLFLIVDDNWYGYGDEVFNSSSANSSSLKLSSIIAACPSATSGTIWKEQICRVSTEHRSLHCGITWKDHSALYLMRPVDISFGNVSISLNSTPKHCSRDKRSICFYWTIACLWPRERKDLRRQSISCLLNAAGVYRTCRSRI